MLLVSLLSYSQYPTVKTIGKDTVVIMTIKQGEEINKKFSDLSDTIKNLEDRLVINKSNFKTLEGQKNKLDSNYFILNSRYQLSESEIKSLQKEIIQREKDFWRERKQWAVWMLLSMAVTVFVASGN